MLKEGDLVDAKVAARILGFHRETLRRLTREGKVPACKVGGKWRYSRQTLGEWIREKHGNAEAPEPKVVYVVDDDIEITELAARLLEGAGYQAVIAEDGQIALDGMEKVPPDLVILDLNMPRLDGPETLKKIRQAFGSVPVIILTGFPDGDLMTRAMQHGPFTLMAKPVNPADLLSTVRGVMNGPIATDGHAA